MEVTGISVPIGSSEVLFAAVYKPPSKPWCDKDTIQLVCLRNKSVLAGDLKVKNPAWSSHTSNPSGEEILTLLINTDVQISASSSSTHYTPRENGDILDTVIHYNVRLSGVTVSDVLDSDHLPIFLNILDQVCARDNSARVERHTDWDLFRSLTSDLIHPRLQADTVEEVRRAASAFAASVASVYRLATRIIALSGLNNAPSDIDNFLQLKWRLWKLWHETRDPTCKTVLNRVTKMILKTVQRNAIERWETKQSNAEITPHAIWLLVKSLGRGDKTKAPSAIRSPAGLKFLPFEEANVIAPGNPVPTTRPVRGTSRTAGSDPHPSFV
jgi:hypothetical protein